MKIASFLTTSITVLPAVATAFVTRTTSSTLANSQQLSAATVTTSSSTDLVPPSSAENDADFIQGLYDENVQCTYGRYPLTIAKGKGCKLWTTDGTEYLDFVSGIATCALGHAHPGLTKAIEDQMKAVHHVSNLYYIPAQAKLAHWLCTNSIADKAFFCNSGAEANEAAIKLARRHAYNRGIKKPVIITAINSFHGRTLAALTATGQTKYQKGFGYGEDDAMVPGFEYVPYNNVEALEQKVQEILQDSGRGLAGIMMEALQGEGGILPGSTEFFAKARQLCDETGALLICDEVQVGMGRSGKLWGFEQLNVEPDVFTSAKALGGGVPIGAMMARGEAAEVFGPGDHASTYGGNPLACSAGLAVAQAMSDEHLLNNVQARGEQLTQGLEMIAKTYPTVLGEVRGWGLLKGVEVKDDVCTAGELVGDAMKQGLLLVPAGPTVARFVPPLVVSKQEVEDALTKFEKAVAGRAGVSP